MTPTATTHNGSPVQNGQDLKGAGGASPIKEGSFLHRESSLHREASADDFENDGLEKQQEQPQQQQQS